MARSEGRTFLSTPERLDSVPTPEGVRSQLGNWIHPEQLRRVFFKSSTIVSLIFLAKNSTAFTYYKG